MSLLSTFSVVPVLSSSTLYRSSTAVIARRDGEGRRQDGDRVPSDRRVAAEHQDLVADVVGRVSRELHLACLVRLHPHGEHQLLGGARLGEARKSPGLVDQPGYVKTPDLPFSYGSL